MLGQHLNNTSEELEKKLKELSLKEGKPFTVFELKNSEALKIALKREVKEATELFNFVEKLLPKIPFNKSMALLYSLVDNYFLSKDLQAKLTPLERISTNRLWETTLDSIVRLLAGNQQINAIIKTNNKMRLFVAKLFLFKSIANYDSFVGEYERYPNPDATQLKNIKEVIDRVQEDNKYVHYFLGNNQLDELYLQQSTLLIVQIAGLNTAYNSLWLGTNELHFHINRKNKESEEQNAAYHAELIYNPTPTSITKVDNVVLKRLLEKCSKIMGGSLKRTQFIVDVFGQSHALVLDVSFNKQTQSLDMICIDSTCAEIQSRFIELLTSFLYQASVKYRILAIQTNLQKDLSSCYTFAYLFSRIISRLSFDKLKDCLSVEQPKFGSSDHNVKWLDLSALGERAVKMGHSYTDMRRNLLKLVHKKEDVDSKIAQWKKCYAIEAPLAPTKEEATNLTAYTSYRRNSLRYKFAGVPFKGLTMQNIYARTNTSNPGHALRRLAAGWGPLREMRFILKEHPEAINQEDDKKHLTPLDWAYQNKKTHRAQVLKQVGALTGQEKKLKI